MTALLDVILPVFLLIGFGWTMARFGFYTKEAVDGTMRFAQNFAVPCLLFRSIANLDLSAAYDPGLMLSFYIGAFSSFAICLIGAMVIFHRPLTDAVAIGFAAMFSNTLLLGLPITERAFGAETLAGNFAIISIHSPLLYATGITLMEWARSRGKGLAPQALAKQVARSIFKQPMVLGITAGFIVNLSGVPLPGSFASAINMMSTAAIPAALFGLGGVLLRYKPEGDQFTILMVCLGSLVIHPGIVYILGSYVFELPKASLRSAVVSAAMAPGVNAYLFSHFYGVAMRIGASAVLVGTALSIFSIWVWLAILA